MRPEEAAENRGGCDVLLKHKHSAKHGREGGEYARVMDACRGGLEGLNWSGGAKRLLDRKAQVNGGR